MTGTVRAYRTPAGNPAFEYSIELGRSPDGKRLQSRTRGFATEPEARAALEAELVDRRRGAYIDPSRTPLAAYLAEWLDTTAPSRSPHSNRSYASIVRARIAPDLGHHRLGQLQGHHVQRWVDGMSRGFAASTVRTAHTVLSMALKQAVRWRLVPHNPAEGVRLPRPDRANRAAWSARDLAAFLAAAERAGDPDLALWRVLAEGQLRIGEALALRWSDCDLDAGVLRVRRTLTRDATGAAAVGDRAKTASSRRDVAIPDATVAALRAHKAAQNAERLAAGGGWLGGDLAFGRADGRLASMAATVGPRLDAACERAAVPRLTPHGLRRTGATLLIRAGMDPRTVADRLGHATTAMTLDVYTAVNKARRREAADAMAAILRDAAAG